MYPKATSTRLLMLSKEKESLGHALFKSMKSMHIPQLPFTYFIMTTLANQVVCETSSINPAFNNFSISTLIIVNHAWPWRFFFCYTGLTLGSIANLWQGIFKSIPIMFVTIQAKHSWYFLNISTSFCLKWSGKFLSILTILGLKLSNSFIS